MSATVPETAPPSEKRLADVLEHKFFLRLHMTAILTATILVGLGTTRGLYLLHVNVFWIRYGLAVITSYVAFIGFVKLWLMYIGMRSESHWLDSINFNGGGSSSWGSSSSSSGGSSGSSFSSSGGKFGGGGSSGSWSEGGSGASSRVAAVGVPVATQRGVTAVPKSSSSSSSSSSGGGGDDFGELILIVLIIALVVAIIASFVWLVWAAPGILSETAFNAALAGALTGHAHKASQGNWMGSVMKKTMLPFSLILVLSIAVGAWAQHYCPSAIRLRDALPCANPR